jgi:hypothetical protein
MSLAGTEVLTLAEAFAAAGPEALAAGRAGAFSLAVSRPEAAPVAAVVGATSTERPLVWTEATTIRTNATSIWTEATSIRAGAARLGACGAKGRLAGHRLERLEPARLALG